MAEYQYKEPQQCSSEVLFKDKGSKFYGYVYPVYDEDDVQNALEELKVVHSKARHFCYAWQLGANSEKYRVNDDGEPSNSAGMPIFGQIQSFGLTNCLIVVVRYFGGTKLGVGGLISAYKTTAKLAIDQTKIITKDITKTIEITCDYSLMNDVMRVVKELHLDILEQNHGLNCNFIIQIPVIHFEKTKERFANIYGLKLKS